MNYHEWEESVPQAIRSDWLWKMEVYRLALFATEIGWQDVTKLAGDTRTTALSNQLYRALGSVSANIAEGYSRGTGKDRATFMSTRLVLPARAAIGITKRVTFSPNLSRCIGSNC